jgi:hypothetical protein
MIKRGTVMALSHAHHAERGVREITYAVALELEYDKLRKEGIPHNTAKVMAHEAAVKMVYETNFDYSSSGKPRMATSLFGRPALQFMTYSTQLLLKNARAFYDMIRFEQSYEARKKAFIQFWGQTGMIAAYAGLTGTPIVAGALFVGSALTSAFNGMASLLGLGDDEEPEDPENPFSTGDFETWFKYYFLKKRLGIGSGIAELFSLSPETAEGIYEAAAKGPVSSATDMDIGSSVAFNTFQLNDRSNRESASSAVGNMLLDTALGASWSLTSQIIDGADEMWEGNTLRGLEKMSPALARGPIKALRFSKEGNTTRDVDPIKEHYEYTRGQLLAQAFGFPSTKDNLDRDLAYKFKQADDRLSAERDSLLSRLGKEYKRATITSDYSGVSNAEEAINKFNKRHPRSPITSEQMQSSLEAQLKSGAESIDGMNFKNEEIMRDYMDRKSGRPVAVPR